MGDVKPDLIVAMLLLASHQWKPWIPTSYSNAEPLNYLWGQIRFVNEDAPI